MCEKIDGNGETAPIGPFATVGKDISRHTIKPGCEAVAMPSASRPLPTRLRAHGRNMLKWMQVDTLGGFHVTAHVIQKSEEEDKEKSEEMAHLRKVSAKD